MKDYFAVFAESAEKQLPPVMVSGRHPFHASSIPSIVADIAGKLRPRNDGRLLEIGCGVGLLLRPLSEMVDLCVGIDHGSLIAEFSNQGLKAGLSLMTGRFPEVKPEGTFDHILVYSVLHYMMGADEARTFIDACLEILAPGGTLLIGDLPNADAAERCHNSNEGRLINQEYVAARRLDQDRYRQAYANQESIEQNVVRPPTFINDQFVLDLLTDLRRRGYEAHVLPQPAGLPFNSTREDVLIHRRQ